MRIGPRFWAAAAATLTLAEIAAIRSGDPEGPLSHALRSAFRTETRAGRIVLRVTWVGLSVWLLPHLTQRPSDQSESAVTLVV